MAQLFIDNADSRARDVARVVRKCIEDHEAEEAREKEWLEQMKAQEAMPAKKKISRIFSFRANPDKDHA